MPEVIERYLNSKEVAALLNISPETLRKWRYSGKVNYYVLGHRTVRFSPIEVQRLIRVGRFRAFHGSRRRDQELPACQPTKVPDSL